MIEILHAGICIAKKASSAQTIEIGITPQNAVSVLILDLDMKRNVPMFRKEHAKNAAKTKPQANLSYAKRVLIAGGVNRH